MFEDCYIRLSMSKPNNGYYVSGSIEFVGKKKDIKIGDKFNFYGLNLYVSDILYKPQSTVVSFVSEGKLLSNLKLPIGLKFTTVNKGILLYMKSQTIEKPPYTLLSINSSDSPWADDNHFNSNSIINSVLSIVNGIYGTNYTFSTNFGYGVKDFQVSRGSDVISTIRSIYPFREFANLFVYNNVIYFNLGISEISELNDFLSDACLISTSAGKSLDTKIEIVGLPGRTGSWSNRVKESNCIKYIEIKDSMTNKEYIHSKIREVSLSGSVLSVSPSGDFFTELDCKETLQDAESKIPNEIKLNPDIEEHSANDIFELLTYYATYFQKIINETEKTTLTITDYEYLDHFRPDTYEKSIPHTIKTTQVVESPLLEYITDVGKAKSLKEKCYFYNVVGNVAIKYGEEHNDYTSVVVIPNYNSEFWTDNSLAWNASSKVRWMDLTS